MPRLFTVRWPWFARFEAVLLWLGGLITIGRVATPSQHPVLWATIAVAAVAPCLAALIAIDRLLTARKGYAMLSVLAIAAWAALGAAMSARLAAFLPTAGARAPSRALIAGAAAFAVHARPLLLGLRDRGFVGTRLRVGRDELAPNPRSRVNRLRRHGATIGLSPYVAWWVMFAATNVASIYRNEILGGFQLGLNRLLSGQGIRVGGDQAIGVRGNDGNFVFDAAANGVRIQLTFDPNASFVTLRSEDARRAGIAVHGLDFSMETKTENGFIDVASIIIGRLEIGNITQTNVAALVARPGELNHDLLGQSLLQRLAPYRIEQNQMTLTSR